MIEKIALVNRAILGGELFRQWKECEHVAPYQKETAVTTKKWFYFWLSGKELDESTHNEFLKLQGLFKELKEAEKGELTCMEKLKVLKPKAMSESLVERSQVTSPQ